MELIYTETFGKQYCMEPSEYEDMSVVSFPFSVRVQNRFERSGIITVSDLLRKTPDDLMGLAGFGRGCLVDIDNILTSYVKDKTITAPSLSKQESTRTALVALKEGMAEYTTSLAELFNMDPDAYSDIHLTTLPFSLRAVNRFQRSGMNTVSDILLKCPADFMQIVGFGKVSLAEIDTVLSSIQNLVITHPEAMEQKDYNGALGGAELSGISEALTLGQEELCDVLGDEFIAQCQNNPEYVYKLIFMCRSFCNGVKRYSVIQNLLSDVPAYRLENAAVGYINAYTQDEDKRQALLKQYSSPDSSLGHFLGNSLDNEQTFILAQKFLKWCTFDLSADVESLMGAIVGHGKVLTVVQARAQKQTLEKIGKKLNVTRERVRQLERKGLRNFAKVQGRVKLIAKLAAEKNGDTVIHPAEIMKYSGEYANELLFLLRNYTSGTYTYDEQLDIFIIGDDTFHDRLDAFVESLPDVISVNVLDEYLEEAKEAHELPAEMVRTAIADAYMLTGGVYHRSRLSLATIYTATLQDYYPNGFMVYDPVEISLFRERVYEKYGDVKLPTNDRALTARVASICILCDKGKYKLKQKQYMPKSLARKIYQHIVYGDEPIYLISSVFEAFKKDLLAAGVDNRYYLQGILHELYGEELFFKRDYVSAEPFETSIYSTVINYIQKANRPVSRNQIQMAYPGISEVTIMFAAGDSNILNYHGEYLHASKLNISGSEESYLKSTVERVISDHVVHHVKDVYEIISCEKPEILTRNAALNATSAFSILEYLFRDEYQFMRPYVAMRSVAMDRSGDRLHELLYAKDEFTFDDIGVFAKENHFHIPSQLDLVNTYNDRFLIADGITVKSIERIGITAEIARVVEREIVKEVQKPIPIRQLTCWAKFPPVNVPWTEWLVYSTINKWGTQLEVAASNSQFRLSIPIVSLKGKMDTSAFVDAFKEPEMFGAAPAVILDNLDEIDDILADMLGDDLLEEDLWD